MRLRCLRRDGPERVERSTRLHLRRRHLRFHPRHDCVVCVGDVRRLQHLDLAHRRDRPGDQRLGMPALLLGSGRADGLERVAERVGGFLRRTKRQALRLEIRVLDREIQDAAVERLILGEAVAELLQQAGLVGVAEHREERVQRADVILNRRRSFSGFLRKGGGCVVGIGHDGAVAGVRRLRELHQQIRRDLARLREPLENNVDVFAAPGGSCEQDDGLQRQKETASR